MGLTINGYTTTIQPGDRLVRGSTDCVRLMRGGTPILLDGEKETYIAGLIQTWTSMMAGVARLHVHAVSEDEFEFISSAISADMRNIMQIAGLDSTGEPLIDPQPSRSPQP